MAAVAQDNEADFGPGEEFFDNDLRPERLVGGFGFCAVLCNDDALTRSQTIRFDDHGVAEAIEVLGLAPWGGLLRTGISMYTTHAEIVRLLEAIEAL